MYFYPTIYGGMATGMGAMLDQMESLSRKNRENQRYNSFQNTNLNQKVFLFIVQNGFNFIFT